MDVSSPLSFIHIPDPDASDSGGGKLDLDWILSEGTSLYKS